MNIKFASFGLPERRLLRDKLDTPKGPDAVPHTGDLLREEREQIREKIERVRFFLREAAYSSGDQKLIGLIENPKVEEMIVAQVEFPKDATIRWLRQTAKDIVAKYHETFEEAEKEIEALKGDAGKQSTAYETALRKACDEVNAANKLMRDSGAGDLPDFGAVSGIADRKERQEQLVVRSALLIDLANIILRTPESEVAAAMKTAIEGGLATIERDVKDPAAKTIETDRLKALLRDLNDIHTKAKPAERINKLKERLAKEGEVLSEDDRKKLDAAHLNVQTEQGKLETEKKQWFLEHFSERAKYLDRLGGTNVEVILTNAIQSADGKFSMDALGKNLDVLGEKLTDEQKNVVLKFTGLSGSADIRVQKTKVDFFKMEYGLDEAKLKIILSKLFMSGVGSMTDDLKAVNAFRDAKPPKTIEQFRDDLIDAWDSEELQKYLQGNLRNLDNPAGVSLSALSVRARLSDAVAGELTESTLDVSVGRLIDVAKIDALRDPDGTLSTGAAKRILDSVKEEEGGLLMIKNDGIASFKEILTYLLYEGAGPDLKASAGKAKGDAEKLWTEKLLPHVKHRGDGVYLIENEANLLAALDAAKITDKAQEMHGIMRARKAHEITWKQSVKMHASEVMTVIEKAAPIWWNYIKSLPRNVIPSAGDPKLLNILDRGNALAGYDAAIQAMLASTDGTKKSLEKAFGILEKRTEKETAVKGDLDLKATKTKVHVAQAEALLRANTHVIERLKREHDWGNRSDLEQQLSLWLAMTYGTDGIQKAKKFLAASAASKDPDGFTREYLEKNLTPDERMEFLSYTGRINATEVISGRNRIAELEQRGIALKPLPLELLTNANLAAGLDLWMVTRDRGEVRPALELILEGPGADALIQAFVTGEEQTYEWNGRTETITPQDANIGVEKIQQELQFKSRQLTIEQKELGKEKFAENPLESGLRAGVSTLKELWNGDWVGKAEAVAAVIAAVWILRKVWKKGWDKDASPFMRLGALSIVGVPVLMAANAIYRQKTGRDFLGEKLRFVPKEERGTALEQHRRRSAREKRYQFLMEESGHVCLQELLSTDDPVFVKDLLKWREQIDAGGYKNYKTGAPKNLDTIKVSDNLGTRGSEEEPYQKLYFTFESLCIQVAVIQKLGGGDLEEQAARGARYIEQRYVKDIDSGKAPLASVRNKGGATMLDVMNSEYRSPEMEAAVTEDRSFIEWLGDTTGLGAAKVKSLARRGYSVGRIMGMRAGEGISEAWTTGKEFALAKWDDAYEWLRVSCEKMKWEFTEDFSAAWRFFWETCKSAGITVITKGPGLVGFTIDKGIDVSARTASELKHLHDMLLTNPEMHFLLGSFENEVLHVLGIDVADIAPEQAEKQWETEFTAAASFYDGRNYPMRDVVAPAATISAFELTKRHTHILFTDDGNTPLSPTKAEEQMTIWLNGMAKTVFGADAKVDTLKPSQRRYLLEALQANIFLEIGKNPKLLSAISKFNTEKSRLNTDKEAATVSKQLAEDSLSEAEKRLKILRQKKLQLDAFEKQRDDWVEEQRGVAGDPAMQDRFNELTGLLHAINRQIITLQRDLAALAAVEREVEIKAQSLIVAQNAFVTAEANLKAHLTKGIDPPIAIKFTQLFAAAGPTVSAASGPNATVLSSSGAPLHLKDLLTKVDYQDRKLFFVPFGWLMGDAEHTALKDTIEPWIEGRLASDPDFQAYQNESKDPLARSAYERYLERVAGNEIFLRSMMESYGGAAGEPQSMFHISIHEARRMDQYLRERQRLVTFKQFLEIWNSVPATERSNKLP